MFRKILSLMLIALLAISSIGACSASDGLTPYHWTLRGASPTWDWQGYSFYDWNPHRQYLYPSYSLKDLPGESLDSKNYVMAFLQYDSYVDFSLNSSLANRSFNVIYSCEAPVSTYYINGNGIYFITIVPYNWILNLTKS